MQRIVGRVLIVQEIVRMPHEVEHEEEYEGEEEKSGVRFHASPEEEELEGDAGPGPLKRLALKKARCETSLLLSL